MIEATYRIKSNTPIDLNQKSNLIALGQTVDTWTPTSRSGLAKLTKHRGVVLHHNQLPKPHATDFYAYELRIGFPEANTEKDIPSLLTMIFGKISMDGQICLAHLNLSKSFLKGKGPRFGISGIRKQLKEPKNPLIMAIFKPCVGLTPKELGSMYYELACGGVHLVKDDEILPDLSICPTEKRLEACLEAAEKAKRLTKQDTLYAINLTGKPSQLLSKATRLKKLGANCFLLNVLSYGYGVLEELRDVGVPIMAHPALAGALCASPTTGISYEVILGTLMRAGGADMVLFPSSYGTVALPRTDTEAIRNQLTLSKLPIRPSFPVPSAGIHPGLVPQILKEYGQDVIINAGGGVHGHPQGARAGVMAFRQALSGGGIELDQALTLWGKH